MKLMLGACDWAYVDPDRKLLYNLTIKAMSAFVALVIGTIQVLGLVAEKLDLTGDVWDMLGAVRERFDVLGFDVLGFLIVALFVIAWAAAALVYPVGRFLPQPSARRKSWAG